MDKPRKKGDEHADDGEKKPKVESLAVEFTFGAEPAANERDPNDMLPLISKAVVDAAWDGNYNRVKTALEKFPLTSNVMEGALVAACEKNNYDIAELLLENGVDPDGLNGSALRNAAIIGHMEIIELLLEHGADPAKNFFEALNNAAMEGHVGATITLLDHCGAEALDALNPIGIAEAGQTHIAEIILTRIRERDGELFEPAANDDAPEKPQKSEQDKMYDKAIGKMRRHMNRFGR